MNVEVQVIVEVQQEKINALTSESIILQAAVRSRDREIYRLTQLIEEERKTAAEAAAAAAPKPRARAKRGETPTIIKPGELVEEEDV